MKYYSSINYAYDQQCQNIEYFENSSDETIAEGTVYWDCNGQGCDSRTLQPWDSTKYKSSPVYAPIKPSELGVTDSEYNLWMTGAFSKDMSQLIGPDDGCCGIGDNGGCGKCISVTIDDPNLVSNPSWKVLVMQKNVCPPWTQGCKYGMKHVDFAVPGHDDLSYSTSNICGKQNMTYLTQEDSGKCIDQNHNPVQGCECNFNFYNDDNVPEASKKLLVQGCKNFSEWGWKIGNPQFKFKVVDCPQAYKDYIHNGFTKDGPEIKK